MWILCGFSGIFKEYQKKVNAFSKEKRRLEDEDKKLKGKQEAYQEIRTLNEGFIPLSIYIPDENSMKEMIEEEVCKVCGRESKRGTDAYNFMVDKLNELLKSQQLTEKKDEMLPFPNNFSRELEQKSISLGYSQDELNNKLDTIKEVIATDN